MQVSREMMGEKDLVTIAWNMRPVGSEELLLETVKAISREETQKNPALTAIVKPAVAYMAWMTCNTLRLNDEKTDADNSDDSE